MKIITSIICCFMFLITSIKANARNVEDIGDMLQVIIPAYALGLAISEKTYYPEQTKSNDPVFQFWSSIGYYSSFC